MMCGKFTCGMALGLMAGAAAGMVVASSRRDVRRVTGKAVRCVNHAMNDAMDSITDAVDSFTQSMGK